MVTIDGFLDAVRAWAATRPDLEAILLVGSHARGTATGSSDVDLVLLVQTPELYVQDIDWARAFGLLKRWRVEDWGAVSSLRAWYEDGPEIEFGFATPDWAAAPLDRGTRQVLADGFMVIYDRAGTLQTSLEALVRSAAS